MSGVFYVAAKGTKGTYRFKGHLSHCYSKSKESKECLRISLCLHEMGFSKRLEDSVELVEVVVEVQDDG